MRRQLERLVAAKWRALHGGLFEDQLDRGKLADLQSIMAARLERHRQRVLGSGFIDVFECSRIALLRILVAHEFMPWRGERQGQWSFSCKELCRLCRIAARRCGA